MSGGWHKPRTEHPEPATLPSRFPDNRLCDARLSLVGQGSFTADSMYVTDEDSASIADLYAATEDQTLTISADQGLLANDSDPDGDSLTASLVSGPSNGSLSLNADGSFTDTADTGYTGEDSFVYSVSDGALTDRATVTLNVQAILVNAGPSQTLLAGASTQLAGSIDPGDLSVSSIQWDFDYDGTTFVADTAGTGTLTPTYTWSNPGSYLVALQVTDTAGTTFQSLTAVLVKPADALLVQAGPDVTVTAGDSFTLSGSYTDLGSSVDTTNIAWDSNYDGQTFNPVITGTLTPTISYATAGTYEVALQVADDAGNTDVSVLQVTVNPISYIGPTADAGSDQTISAGSSTSFSGSYTDPDGTVSLANVAWDFNYDGSDFNPDVTDTLTPTLPTGVGPGTYTVALQVTDSNGLSSLSTLQLTVTNVAPTVNAGFNLTVTAGSVVSFSGSYTDVESTDDQMSWDFNYDGVTFNGGAANTLTPQHVFTTAGTYTVALQVSNDYGDSGLDTLTVTVLPSSGLVVDAGPDQFLNEGDTADFAASWSDASGTVDPNSAQWDFDYDGTTFVADASASGTLTPSYTYNTPGLYQVAVQLTDSTGDTEMGLLNVAVQDVAPTADAGDDQTVAEGSTVTFQGTASDPGGSGNSLQVAWDFDYDGSDFVADASANGSLTPSYVYTTPGTYLVALQATDQYGLSDLETMVVTVTDVAPTATVSNSGTTPMGSPVTFTVSNLVDQTPGDTPTISADWTGSGQFEEITSAELTQNADGSLSFTHVYNTASGPAGYSAVIEIDDGYGGATDYTQNVVVTAVPPTATFGPDSGSSTIDSTTPFLFTASEPFDGDTLPTFTYFVSLDGGAYSSGTSPLFQLPTGISDGQHTLTAYVEDAAGNSSNPITWTGTISDAQTIVVNSGTGDVQLDWDGAANPIAVTANSSYTIAGTVTGLSLTLLDANATYDLASNASIDSVSAADGVTNVALTVDTTGVGQNFPLFVGDGHIGTITMPVDSSLNVTDRGELGNIIGPGQAGELTGTTANDLVFRDLTGSITGLDHINDLDASGWLGQNTTQQVQSDTGIDTLTAFGVGARVQTDLNYQAGDYPMQLTVGAGGVSGAINAGNVSEATIKGFLNVLTILLLQGNLDAGDANITVIKETKANPTTNLFPELSYNSIAKGLLFSSQDPSRLTSLTVTKQLKEMQVNSSLTVDQNISVGSDFGALTVKGDLTIGTPMAPGNLMVSDGVLGPVTVQGNMTVTGLVRATTIEQIAVDGNLQAVIRGWKRLGQDVPFNGNVGEINVCGNFTGAVISDRRVEEINVGGNFLMRAGQNALISCPGSLGPVTVFGNIGGTYDGTGKFTKLAGNIFVNRITLLQSTTGSINLGLIEGKEGIGAILAPQGYLRGFVDTVNGSIANINVYSLQAAITAKASAGVLGQKSGYIGSIQAVNIINWVRIQAYRSIGRILDTGDANPGFTVEAQGGGSFAGGVQALRLLCPTATKFLGTVKFEAPGVLYDANQDYVYSVGQQLLQVATSIPGATQLTTWVVTGPMGATTKFWGVKFGLDATQAGTPFDVVDQRLNKPTTANLKIVKA